MRTVDPLRTGESGFTLVELLVAMLISLIVVFATLQSFDIFASDAARQTRVTDGNDQVRSVMDHTVADLRGASVILKTTTPATDLAYAVPVTSSTTRVKRLCVASGDLYSSSSAPAAGSPVAPTAACTSGNRVASLRAGTSTAFTYDGASAPTTTLLVKNVGLKFSLDTTTAGKPGSTTLEASAARRSSGTLPITDADLNSNCNGSVPLLSLDAGIPGVAGLTVNYATAGGVALGVGVGTASVPITIPAGITTILATVTDALGVTNTIRKDVSCS